MITVKQAQHYNGPNNQPCDEMGGDNLELSAPIPSHPIRPYSIPSHPNPSQVIVRVRPEPGASAPPVVVARDERRVALLPLPSPQNPDPTSKAKPAVDTKVHSMRQ